MNVSEIGKYVVENGMCFEPEETKHYFEGAEFAVHFPKDFGKCFYIDESSDKYEPLVGQAPSTGNVPDVERFVAKFLSSPYIIVFVAGTDRAEESWLVFEM